MGKSAKMVVKEVIKMGRKRTTPAWWMVEQKILFRVPALLLRVLRETGYLLILIEITLVIYS